ncbi:NAD-dependent epimerase/dehydratase family protein [Nocardia pseudobrasiliensis]|uniref:Nucleoside-diphosphate-sugar epimerase n=1 Tax=Nocardia pseudobrasiliensis TaxID=45979 RepID=A0A370I3S4_9NOCA|nr:NAD-dependent epimerase/dehydratase family protein [Nocardia pseudobrasiliensis]RDI63964.1 nucleoside-diphosphate-sugar epimerase [Nocardia pseudobrasiliensis]
MRILVLGGTSFLSRWIAHEAVTRGHEVICAARGRSGSVPVGARLVVVDRDRPDALAALAQERFDAVIDVARAALGQVLAALDALADRAPHWIFVSSVSAYADTATVGQTVDAPLREAIRQMESDTSGERYGGIKVACETSVRERLDNRALIVRPGLIGGPWDRTDRFGYWPARFARGGRAIIPDATRQPIQHIDVRDLAAWIVSAAETRLTGTQDAVGPITELGALLREIADVAGASDLELVPVDPKDLAEAQVSPWSGPRSLPLWLPADHDGLVTHDPAPAFAAGLKIRALAETVHATLEDECARGLHRSRGAGLSADDERDLLRRFGL